MRRWWLAAGLLIGAGVMYGAMTWYRNFDGMPAIPQVTVKEKPLEKYTIENLQKHTWGSSQILPEKMIERNDRYWITTFNFKLEGKKVAGLAHIPNQCKADSPCPVVIQIRGYADSANYATGYGTEHTAKEFAKAGFISLAPDFLGYGSSDKEADNPWEARFQTYTTVMELLGAVPTFNLADYRKIGLWGHSNGGQIALTVLEITGKNYPTVVWAPVSKPFPYSVLYFTDTYEDKGKWIRSALAEFEKDYDVEKYSLVNYLENIQAPLQIQQGGKDDQVPQRWTDDLIGQLQKINKTVTYYVYPGADHNLLPIDNWNKAVNRDVEFFKNKL